MRPSGLGVFSLTSLIHRPPRLYQPSSCGRRFQTEKTLGNTPWDLESANASCSRRCFVLLQSGFERFFAICGLWLVVIDTQLSMSAIERPAQKVLYSCSLLILTDVRDIGYVIN